MQINRAKGSDPDRCEISVLCVGSKEFRNVWDRLIRGCGCESCLSQYMFGILSNHTNKFGSTGLDPAKQFHCFTFESICTQVRLQAT
jgi:hypothetical protein